VSGQRTYIAKDSSTASVGWHGDIVGESGAGSGASLQIINWGNLTTGGMIEIGTPGGTNEMRGKVSSINFRGSGWIHCYSRIAFDGGTWPNKNDAGTVILYATNNTFTGVTVTQGTVQMGRANVMPAGASVVIGKSSEKTFSTFNLDGYDQTFAGFYEQNTSYLTHKNRVMTPDGKPATLTVNGSSNRAWGSSHSWIEGPLTLVKAGSFNFTLNGTNTYTGATLMQAGTLTLNSAKALGGTTNVVLTGGTIVANASGALNANGELTVPDPAVGTLSLADGTAQTVEYLVVNGIVQPSGTYSKSKAGSNPRYAFLARGTGSGTLLVRKGSGFTIIFR
jgi:autotransporter-associated beta strand protein